jgi:ATP-dependent helicase/nuclease subunit B
VHGTDRHRALLESGGELVTATPRQARALAVDVGRAATARGLAVWATPRITPYGAWLEHEARAFDERPLLLADDAALRLWQLIIAESAAGDALISVEATAAEAARAWALAQEWRVPLAELSPSTPEESAFRDWAREFERRTAARGALDRARLPLWLAARLPPGPPRAPLGFHGFRAATPARTRLGEALGRAGRPAEELALAAGPARLARHQAPSPQAECEAIAAWIGARLAADPAARLIVIVPELAGRAAALRRLLDDALAPELLAPGAPDTRPYQFATPPRLADYSVAATALGVLSLARSEITVLELGRLLRSPYLPATAAEAAQRARLDADLRRWPEPVLTTHDLAARLRTGRCPEPAFAALVEAARAPLVRRGRQRAADWSEAMQRALRAAGWPKGRAPAPSEYQAARAVTEALAALGGLDPILPPLTLAGALAELATVFATTPVQPDAADAPVLVLDGHEDPGLPCDGLWVAGLAADRFPANAQSTPFLPLALQRERGLPGASPAAALAEARAALAGWRRSTRELVLSVALADGETASRSSPLVPPAPCIEDIPPAGARAVQIRATRRVEPWHDPGLPAWPAGARVGGGVKVLELMAQCPFRAAAELRLEARALESPAVGLPRWLRGQLAHAALATLWGELGSQAGLAALDAPARSAAVRSAVERAFAAERSRLPNSRLVVLERDWLGRAIGRLLSAELGREPFTVIEREQSHRLAPAGLALEVRVDRVDRLADGATVLIDYKTGRGGQRRWTGARPDPVQLPLYATLRDPAPVAVAIARLPLADQPFAGIAARDGVLPHVRSLAATGIGELRGLDWVALVAGWRAAVEGLAAGFAAGDATVDPAEGACRRCPLATLCRITSPTLSAEEPAGGEDD